MGGAGELGGFQMIWLAGKLLIGKRGGPAPFLHVWPEAPVGLGARKQPELAYGVDVLRVPACICGDFLLAATKMETFSGTQSSECLLQLLWILSEQGSSDSGKIGSEKHLALGPYLTYL